MIYSYSLNGELIAKCEVSKDIIDIAIGENTNFAEYLVYLEKSKGRLVGKKTPFLEDEVEIIRKEGTVFALFDNKRMAVVGDDPSDFSFVWNPYCINAR